MPKLAASVPALKHAVSAVANPVADSVTRIYGTYVSINVKQIDKEKRTYLAPYESY